jgi:hypothetical protein
MAIVNYAGPTGITDTTSLDVFIPQLWADEIVASYKANIIMGPLVVDMPFVGKKGASVHIPYPARQVANAKVETETVLIIEAVETNRTFIVDKHFEYSKFIEDFASVQAIDTYRQFYTDDAGYALAKKKDTFLWDEGQNFAGTIAEVLAGTSTVPGGTDGTNYGLSKAVIGSTGTTLWDDTTDGNSTALADAGIRNLIQGLDDGDVPFAGRVLTIPPVEKNSILGAGAATDLRMFVKYDSTGEGGQGNAIRNGIVGDLYGVEVYVSSNSSIVDDANGGLDHRLVLMFQREALILMQQAAPRVQTQYKQEFLATLFTSDEIYGVGLLRPEAGIAVVVPA